VTVIPGSEIINSILYMVSQSLFLPVIVILLIILVHVIIEVGGIISEYSIRKKTAGPFTTKRPNISWGCDASRKFADIKPYEVIVGMNSENISCAVNALEALIN
jgi:hypothetical protein